LNENVAHPTEPTQPEPIHPPKLEAPMAPGLETPKALMKRSKEVAKSVKQFIRENRAMVVNIEAKKYPRAEVWQFCAACFGVTAMVTKTEQVLNEHDEAIGFISIAHAINATGRVISGAEAACMREEPDWCDKPAFQRMSMSQTRSCSKVLRNLYAYVMVMEGLQPTPAEEMGVPEKSEKRREREFTVPCFECGNKVSYKRSLETRRKYGKELCLECCKKADDKSTGMNLITDPKAVEKSIADMKAKKANGGIPTTLREALDYTDKTETVA
jgi:hypothetical protein